MQTNISFTGMGEQMEFCANQKPNRVLFFFFFFWLSREKLKKKKKKKTNSSPKRINLRDWVVWVGLTELNQGILDISHMFRKFLWSQSLPSFLHHHPTFLFSPKSNQTKSQSPTHHISFFLLHYLFGLSSSTKPHMVGFTYPWTRGSNRGIFCN